MESLDDDIEEGPLSDLSENNMEPLDKAQPMTDPKGDQSKPKNSLTEELPSSQSRILSKEYASAEQNAYGFDYISENIVLDPGNQQTRFYNLQAEATLSSLDSNMDPSTMKDTYHHPISAGPQDEHSSGGELNVAQTNLVQETHNDGIEGDDEYEEDQEDQKERTQNKKRNERQDNSPESLQLSLDLSEGPINMTQLSTNEIIFSPGGNEAYVFAQSSIRPSNLESNAEAHSKSTRSRIYDRNQHLKTTSPNFELESSQLPSNPIGEIHYRHVRDPDDEVGIRSTKNYAAVLPRGERPTTVGQSDDNPKKNIQGKPKYGVLQKDMPSTQSRSPRLNPAKKDKEDKFLQGRMKAYESIMKASTTDDTDNVYSTDHSADPSPRRLPELPSILTREEFLNQNSNNIPPYHDIGATTRERDEEEVSGHGALGTGHFDRTTSPSIASVTSGYSVTSTGSMRKNLEWDTTADLRPGKHWGEGDEVIQNQQEASKNLDNLSQMVIETYSNYFPREDPEGKPSKKPVATSSGASQASSRKDNIRSSWFSKRGIPRPPGFDKEAERRDITNNWIESYTRQHPRSGNSLENSNKPNIERYSQNRVNTHEHQQLQERRRRRSKSADKYDEVRYVASGESVVPISKTSPASTPEKRHNKKGHGHKMKQRLKYGSPLKSASLTELDLCPTSIPHTVYHDSDRRGSSSSLMSHWLTKNPASQILTFDQHGPSSTSSTGTVVQMLKDQNCGSNNVLLEQVASGSSSLPPELQHILIQATNSYVNSKQNNLNIISKDSHDDSRGSRETSKTSQTSLSSSKQSGSRSYETVIEVNNTINEQTIITQAAKKPWSKDSRCVIPKRSIPRKQFDNSESMDTEEEIQLVKRSAYIVRKDAEGKESGGSSGQSNPAAVLAVSMKIQESEVDNSHRAQSLPNENWSPERNCNIMHARTISTQTSQRQNLHSQRRKQSPMRKSRGASASLQQSELPLFQPSSAATTSEDERLMGLTAKEGNDFNMARREHMVEGAGGGRVRRTSYPANSSTLESGAPIDRAKSFEYFPGDNFPLQENSSSYEYLPGHMISDRPGTVVSNHPQENIKHKDVTSNVDELNKRTSHNVETPPSQITNGEYSTTSSIQSSSNCELNVAKNRNYQKLITTNTPKTHHKKRKPYTNVYEIATETHSLAIDLDSLSHDMMHKYKHLQNAQVSQTRNFYKKMRRYIEFISTPSKNPRDCSLKQKIADKLIHVMTEEEKKLSSVRSLSTQFGNLFVSDTTHIENSTHHSTAVTPSPDPVTTQGTLAPSTSVETDENEIIPSQSIEMPTRQIGDEIDSPEKLNSYEKDLETISYENDVNNYSNEENVDINPANLHRQIASPHYFPSLQNWIGPSKIDNSYPNSSDVEIQKLRIEQMKKLRKEIRKLEKLECIRLNKALGGNSEDNLELLRQIKNNQSSLDSLLSENTEKTIGGPNITIPGKAEPRLQSKIGRIVDENEKNERSMIEGKSASGSDINIINNAKNSMQNKKLHPLIKTVDLKPKDDSAKPYKSRHPIISPSTDQLNDPSQQLPGFKIDANKTRNSNKSNQSAAKNNPSSYKATTSSIKEASSGKTHSSIKVFSGKVTGNGLNTYTKSSKPKGHKHGTTASGITHPNTQQSTQTQQDFSQNFPTPRSTVKSISTDYRSNTEDIDSRSTTPVSQTTTSISSFEKSDSKVNSNISKKLSSGANRKRKSLAYYLPLCNNATPINVGSRILREKELENTLNKENRNILSNYISALDASSIEIHQNKSKKTVSKVFPVASTVDPSKTLQEALIENKQNFIKKSKYRVEILRQIKEERCLFSELQRRVLENLAKEAPKNQIKARLPLTSVQKPKPRRLFNYKEMVEATRRKYEQLPEVLNARYDAKKMSNYRTNRLMADIYQRKLKDNVLKGTVSMTHTFNPFN